MINSTTFIKIGDRLINPALITSVELYHNEYRKQSVLITLADTMTQVFYDEEAEILRQFFLSGSRTYDLESFYGERAKQSQIKSPELGL